MDKKIGSDNQGEGNRDAANAYNADTRAFIRSGKVDKAAQDAREALDGKEGEELRQAEKDAKAHAKGTDEKGVSEKIKGSDI